MHTGSYKNSNFNIRIAPAELRQELRHDNMARDGTGVVTGDNRTRPLPLSEFTQSGSADRISQGSGDEFHFRLRRLIFMGSRKKHACHLFVRQFKRDFFFSKRYFKFFHEQHILSGL